MLQCVRKKGQGVSGEYVVMAMLVIISITVMTTYVRRTLQGRYRDGSMEVVERAALALGNAVYYEYEPYYVNTTTDVDSATFAEQKDLGLGAQERTNVSDRKVTSTSIQKPF
jgi:hypothetical protein